MKRNLIWIAALIFALACNLPQPTSPLNAQDASVLYATQLGMTAHPATTLTGSLVSSETPTVLPSLTPTETPSPTPVLIHQGPDEVTVPILLYHHIQAPKRSSEYYLPPEKFEEQMELLHNWGYTTITMNMLVKAIREGADLPPRPVIISFDDGQISVHDNALPIMQKYGFTGIVYLVGTYLNAQTFMNTEQVLDLVEAGWEIGSHSMKHMDLTHMEYDKQRYEIFKSREVLNEKLGVPVSSFAYPFGLSHRGLSDLVEAAGYTSAVGVGYTYDQGLWNLYLLQRRDVRSSYDMKRFASFLPWQGDISFLPSDTPTPTPRPTRTPVPTRVK